MRCFVLCCLVLLASKFSLAQSFMSSWVFLINPKTAQWSRQVTQVLLLESFIHRVTPLQLLSWVSTYAAFIVLWNNLCPSSVEIMIEISLLRKENFFFQMVNNSRHKCHSFTKVLTQLCYVTPTACQSLRYGKSFSCSCCCSCCLNHFPLSCFTYS